MQRNTPGLLDRRIGPKDMFIVLLYTCMFVFVVNFLLKSSTVVVYSLLRSIYVVS